MDVREIAAQLDPVLLPRFGVRRRQEREHDSAYYLLRAAPLRVEPRRTNLLVTLGTPDGDVLHATLPRLAPALHGRLCWVVLATHPAPSTLVAPRPLHCHILRLWPAEGKAADSPHAMSRAA